jgi:N,N'-diacetyllegionaminate synthase
MNYFNSLNRAFIIAEIGVNHNGDVALAKKTIDAAKTAGADAVKFQTFKADALAMRNTPLVSYQERFAIENEGHYEMLKRLELGEKDHYELVNYCRHQRIEFLSTPYDIDSAKFLLQLKLRFFKTSSADLVDLPLHNFIASTGIPTMIATGMATLGEIESVVRIYNNYRHRDLLLLHCVSSYPCSDASINLRAMQQMGLAFMLPYGLSDHSNGFLAAVASVSMGGRVIEKHFTLDNTLPGPDHTASLEPAEFSDLVRNVRRIELMLGEPYKCCQPEEVEMAEISRKSLVTVRSLRAGHRLTDKDLVLMRPGTGLAAKHLSEIIGKCARTDLPIGHQLKWIDLEEPS